MLPWNDICPTCKHVMGCHYERNAGYKKVKLLCINCPDGTCKPENAKRKVRK